MLITANKRLFKWRNMYKNGRNTYPMVYHNYRNPVFGIKLHNSSRYVNKCNQIYQYLCIIWKYNHIFGDAVYIKII